MTHWTDFCTALYLIPPEQSTPWILPINIVTPDTKCVIRLSTYDKLLRHSELSPVIANPPIRSMVIEGQSGTGKSTFAIFLMRALMDHGEDATQRHFLFSTIGDDCIYGWHNGITQVYTYNTAPVYDENIVWIMNQSEHGCFYMASCRKVLIASGEDGQTKQFKCSAGSFLQVIHMPLPTEGEVRSVAAVHGVSTQDINIRILQVGSILRDIVATNYIEVKTNLNTAIQQCTFKTPIYNSLSYRIFYKHADDNFIYIKPTFGTKYIAAMYMKAWRLNVPNSFQQFIASPYTGSLAYIRDIELAYTVAYKEYSHNLLADGGKFRIRTLHHRSFTIPTRLLHIHNMQFPSRNTQECQNTLSFDTLTTDYNSINNIYLKLASDNVGAVDAIVINPIATSGVIADVFLLTTSTLPVINSSELDNLIDRIEQYVYPSIVHVGVYPNYTIRLFFVVPDYLFESFERQHYSSVLSEAHRGHLEQHVLEVVTKRAR